MEGMHYPIYLPWKSHQPSVALLCSLQLYLDQCVRVHRTTSVSTKNKLQKMNLQTLLILIYFVRCLTVGARNGSAGYFTNLMSTISFDTPEHFRKSLIFLVFGGSRKRPVAPNTLMNYHNNLTLQAPIPENGQTHSNKHIVWVRLIILWSLAPLPLC